MSQDSQIARFDVGGQRFATTRMTLSRYPESKLSCASSGEIDARIEGILKLSDGTIFIGKTSFPANSLNLNFLLLQFVMSGNLQTEIPPFFLLCSLSCDPDGYNSQKVFAMQAVSERKRSSMKLIASSNF